MSWLKVAEDWLDTVDKGVVGVAAQLQHGAAPAIQDGFAFSTSPIPFGNAHASHASHELHPAPAQPPAASTAAVVSGSAPQPSGVAAKQLQQQPQQQAAQLQEPAAAPAPAPAPATAPQPMQAAHAPPPSHPPLQPAVTPAAAPAAAAPLPVPKPVPVPHALQPTAPQPAPPPAGPTPPALAPSQPTPNQPEPSQAAPDAAQQQASSSKGPQGAREQQLVRLAEQLKERLQASRAECSSLEQLLSASEARAEAEADAAAQAQRELHALREAKAAAEGALQGQLAQQAILLGERARAAEASERQVLRLHSLLEQAEASSRALAQGKHDMGVEMSEALKLQLSQTEAKLDAELKATAAIKAAAAARESDLQQALASSTDALSETQHALTQARAQAAGLQDELALLHASHTELQHRLQQAESAPRPPRGDSDGTQQQVVRLTAELEQARRLLADAEQARGAAASALAAARNEVQVLQLEVQQLSHSTAAPALEAQLREASELLVEKGGQIQALAAEKAALQLQHEREMGAAIEEVHRARRQQQQLQQEMALGGRAGEYQGGRLGPLDGGITPSESIALVRRLMRQGGQTGRVVRTAILHVDRATAVALQLFKTSPVARFAVLGALAYVCILHLCLWSMTLRMHRVAAAVVDGGGHH